MAEIRQKMRGNTAAADTYVGAQGQIVVDLSRMDLRIYDGIAAGGKRIPNLEYIEETFMPLEGGEFVGPVLFSDSATFADAVTFNGLTTFVGDTEAEVFAATSFKVAEEDGGTGSTALAFMDNNYLRLVVYDDAGVEMTGTGNGLYLTQEVRIANNDPTLTLQDLDSGQSTTVTKEGFITKFNASGGGSPAAYDFRHVSTGVSVLLRVQEGSFLRTVWHEGNLNVANLAKLDSANTFTGTLGIDNNLPILNFDEADVGSRSRLYSSGGVFFMETQDPSGANAGGSIRIAGWAQADLGEFSVKKGGAFHPVALYSTSGVVNQLDFPIGSVILAEATTFPAQRNQTLAVYIKDGTTARYTVTAADGGDQLLGTWRSRGGVSHVGGEVIYLVQRVS